MQCPACDGTHFAALLTTPSLPVHCNAYAQDVRTARSAPRATIELVQCDACAHVFNRAFDEHALVYDARYETSLHHSLVFVAWAEDLIDRLSKPTGERRLDILEIGCGRGEFLAMLGSHGHRCRGFDRSYDGRFRDNANLVIESCDYQPDRHGTSIADLVISRHVLEHLTKPLDLLVAMRKAMRADGAGYLEVPSGSWTLRDGGIWDLIYEHASYFVPSSLSALLERAELTADSIEESFGGQFLAAHIHRESTRATPAARSHGDDISQSKDFGTRFAVEFASRLVHWSRTLEAEFEAGHEVAIWGIGSKAVTFLNLLPIGESIAHAIDQNPVKADCFVPGTGHRIADPSSLRGARLDTVLVANPRYLEEIRGRLGELGHPNVALLPLN